MYVNINDAKENFAELVAQLENDKQKEIFLTEGGKPVIKMIHAENIAEGRKLGLGKNDLKLPSDFDEVFDGLDDEIGKMFLKEGA